MAKKIYDAEFKRNAVNLCDEIKKRRLGVLQAGMQFLPEGLNRP